jgi:hypothetical protein
MVTVFVLAISHCLYPDLICDDPKFLRSVILSEAKDPLSRAAEESKSFLRKTISESLSGTRELIHLYFAMSYFRGRGGISDASTVQTQIPARPRRVTFSQNENPS